MALLRILPLVALTLPTAACDQPPPAIPAIAFVAFGGNGPPDEAPASNRIENFVDWATDAGPRFRKHGIKRVHMQNPGGLFRLVEVVGDGRSMRVDQWILAERARCPYANRDDFRAAVDVLRDYGITEVIVYLGSPTQLRDPVNELPHALEAFTDCGPIVSFGFDALFEDGHVEKWQELWAEDSPYRTALVNLRKQGHKIYAEARVHPPQLKAGLAKLVDGTIAAARFDVRHPDLTGQPGESIRVTDPQREPAWPEIADWPANVTPALRSSVNWGPLMDKTTVVIPTLRGG
jgi:hypothetical protein